MPPTDPPRTGPPCADLLSDLLAQRYGQGHPPGVRAEAAQGILEALVQHRSVRAFLPDALPPHTLETLVAAAQSAATSSNLQTWSVVAVQDPDRKRRLSQWAGGQAHMVEAPLLLVFLADLSRIDRIAQQLGRTVDGLHYLDTFLMGVIDAALAAQNATVMAESMGLGTVYIGGMRNRPEEVAAELGLPPKVFAVFGLVVGVPDPQRASRIKPRLPQDKVLHHERYAPAATLEQELGNYNSTTREFQAREGMPEHDWSDTVTRRLHGPAQLTGRDRLVEALRHAGFDLR